MQERIAESFGEAKTEWLAELYSSAYQSSDLTPSEVWEEVVCDSLGDMNIFHDIPVMEEHAQELLDETKKAAGADIETMRVRGPPTAAAEDKASRDMEERSRALRPGEMVNDFRDKVNWPAYYREIAKEEYNPDYYDDGEISYINLGSSLLTIEMQRNGEWSVVDVKENEIYGNTDEKRSRAESAAENGTKGLSWQRENDRYRVNLGRAGAVGKSGVASGQRSDSEGYGKSGSADHETDTRTKAGDKVTGKFSQDLAELDALRKENERLKNRVERGPSALHGRTPFALPQRDVQRHHEQKATDESRRFRRSFVSTEKSAPPAFSRRSAEA